jgi:tetratricopeptide (TPR) repeat protein
MSGLLSRTVVCVALVTAIAGPSFGQDNVRDTRVAAHAALSQGAFAEAIPLLQQLVAWLNTSTSPSVISELELMYYQLGLCQFMAGNFAAARDTFSEYLKRYRRGPNAGTVAVFFADSHRFESNFAEALKAYGEALKTYTFDEDWKTDVEASMAKCFLAQEKWTDALPHLGAVYRRAPDFARRNWAATLMVISFLRSRQLDQVYDIMPTLLQPESFASRSVALNLTAIEVADELFADERYRDALWVYRMIYGRDLVAANCRAFQDRLERKARWLRRQPGQFRQLVRVQERLGEVEQELKALEDVEEYDAELYYRMARSYFEGKRFREARELFLYLHDTSSGDRAEECLYMAFTSAAQIQPWDRALQIGADYMAEFEGGAYYDTVSLLVAQMRAKLQQWPDVIAVLAKALEVHPQHENIVECLFLLGYASLMEEQYPSSVRHLRRMNQDFPGNDREEDGLYWMGMALLFDKAYAEARDEFERLLARFPDTTYAEDASFRAATCDFGLSDFRAALTRFTAFVQRYPGSKLRGEAEMMLGDCEGSFGRLPEAVAHYRRALEGQLHIEFYNYTVFRCGEILSELKDYEAVLDWLKAYMDRNREGSNLPMAIHGVGNALWEKGEPGKALDYFRGAIEQYGSDRTNLGVDLILEEWVNKAQKAPPDVARQHWQALRKLEDDAVNRTNRVLSLRLRRILPYMPGLTVAEKSVYRASLMRSNNIPYAGPGLLAHMADEALRAGATNLAVAAAQETVRVFPETDYGLAARMVLARDAVARGAPDEALPHLEVIINTFAASTEAGEAQLLKAGILLDRKELDAADQIFSTVLATREWKPLWPEALFGRGQVARASRKFVEATAYFERIYVLYTANRPWVARAYLARAESLERANRVKEARETLDEMLALDDLKSFPAYAEAEALRKRVERQL